MYVMDQPFEWEDYLHLVEFSYNNGYQPSWKMSPFEIFHGRKCNTRASWTNPTNKVVPRTKFKEIEEQMVNIKHNLKEAHDMQELCRQRQDT
jgi:hypothetical protein